MCRISVESKDEADAVAIDKPAISAGESFGAGGATSGAQQAEQRKQTKIIHVCWQLSLNVIKCNCTISLRNVKPEM